MVAASSRAPGVRDEMRVSYGEGERDHARGRQTERERERERDDQPFALERRGAS